MTHQIRNNIFINLFNSLTHEKAKISIKSNYFFTETRHLVTSRFNILTHRQLKYDELNFNSSQLITLGILTACSIRFNAHFYIKAAWRDESANQLITS